MIYCRTTIVKFNSEKLADEASADYSINAPSEFPEAEILLFTLTGPTSAVVASVYPSEEISKRATAARNSRMDKAAHRRKKRRGTSRRSDIKIDKIIFFSGVYGSYSPTNSLNSDTLTN